MKKLLIIALILWGCDYAPTEPSNTCDDDVCAIGWVLYNIIHPTADCLFMYYVEGYEPKNISDTIWFDEPEPFTNPNTNEIDTMYFDIPKRIFYAGGDTLIVDDNNAKNNLCMSPMQGSSIIQYKIPNLIRIKVDGEYSTELIPEDYEVLKYEYKQ